MLLLLRTRSASCKSLHFQYFTVVTDAKTDWILHYSRRADVLEDEIELEGLRGTVRGLESWIGRWKRDNNRRESEEGNSENTNGLQWRGSDGNEDALMDGINAWMRGWKDVEEGFRIRARWRKRRRREKKKAMIGSEAVNLR